MAVTNILQTLALAVAPLDGNPYTVLGQANDGQSAPVAYMTQSPLFVCTANHSAAADVINFLFTGATIAALNLASGETRVLTAAYRGSGVAAACQTAKIDFTVCNIAGTLTITNTAAAALYGVSGASASGAMVASVVGTGIQVAVTAGTSAVGPNDICELYLAGGKSKTT